MSRERARRSTRKASISLDLDNQWSYMKTHGDDAWSKYPSYLDWVVPRVLEFLDEADLKITFFIVGQDAVHDRNMAALRSIARAGHEIGNHSFNHEPWLHLYTEDELESEFENAETAIENATGVRPVGFRGPGFSLSPKTLEILAHRGYKYDATVFPNVLNPLARAYFFATSSLSDEEKERRKALFGTWKDAFRPVSPFRWRIGENRLLEVPVTTMPIFKTPIHLSYILYASKYSEFLARAYFRFALLMCRISGVEPSILLHPLDFMGYDDTGDLAFFPGMDMRSDRKIRIVRTVIAELRKHYELCTMLEHAESVGPDIREMELQASTS